MKKVVIGLSGGVDSSVAAALLKEQGYDLTGVYLTCWSGPGCRSEEDRQDALDVALQLSIPFEHLDFREDYKKKVYEYMMREYEAGRTPNPDVMCNREIKFGLFYEWALGQGFDYVATGHYARIGYSRQQPDFSVLTPSLRSDDCARKNSDYCLLRSLDEHKDQTYFLHQLRREQLAHVLFPIGHLTKTEVRAEAEKRGLLTAKKPDSTGICFIGEVPVKKFLKERINPQEGVMRYRGNNEDYEVGKHDGVWFYTIGQRIRVTEAKKLQEAGFDTTKLPHFYVIDKDVETNTLVVGTEESLYKDEIMVGEMHWIKEVEKQGELSVRIRHTGELIPVKSLRLDGNVYTVELEKPVRAAASGQTAVFYEDTVCLGGGIIR